MIERQKWLGMRYTDPRIFRSRVARILIAMPSTGKSRDGGGLSRRPRMKPLRRATGPGSYAEASPQQMIARLRAGADV